MRLEDLKVGDRITVQPYSYGTLTRPYQFRRVARVGKNNIIDDTGGKWSMSGVEWGRASDYAQARVYPFEEEHAERNAGYLREWNMAQMRRRLASESTWRDVNETTLRAVCAALDAAVVAAAETKAKGGTNGEA